MAIRVNIYLIDEDEQYCLGNIISLDENLDLQATYIKVDELYKAWNENEGYDMFVPYLCENGFAISQDEQVDYHIRGD